MNKQNLQEMYMGRSNRQIILTLCYGAVFIILLHSFTSLKYNHDRADSNSSEPLHGPPKQCPFAPVASNKQLRVCMVTKDYGNADLDWDKIGHKDPRWSVSGHINQQVAENLQSQGHSVTLVHAGDASHVHGLKKDSKKIRIQHVKGFAKDVFGLDQLRHSYDAFAWLQENAESQCDAILVSITHGIGYYTALAKHQGTHFKSLPVVSIAAETYAQCLQRISELTASPYDMIIEWFEKETFNNAQLSMSIDKEVSFQSSPVAQPLCSVTLSISELQQISGLITGLIDYNAKAQNDGKAIQLEKISVVIATYNHGSWLVDAVQSVINQNYPGEIEILVIDDCSPDKDHQKVLQQLPNLSQQNRKVVVIRNEKNIYLGASRNVGMKAATGKFIMFLDGDDQMMPQEVKETFQILQRTKVDAICVRPLFFTAAKPEQQTTGREDWLVAGGPLPAGFFLNTFGGPNFMIKADVLRAMGGFTTDRTGYEDWEFWIRFLIAGYRFEKPVLPMYHYRFGNSNSMIKTMSNYDGIQRILRHLPALSSSDLQRIAKMSSSLYGKQPSKFTIKGYESDQY
ncbi:hypothetical protein MIR68_008350 [Amoeboaphelidium protococcarum]|nr:hypothetical protein MIR68_008350 [Amoeboaphelidium protococcarum]